MGEYGGRQVDKNDRQSRKKKRVVAVEGDCVAASRKDENWGIEESNRIMDEDCNSNWNKLKKSCVDGEDTNAVGSG